jgi:predicted benzoate:H+ symporter BenE
MLGNYFKPTSKTVLKVSLALKGFIGTISAATFFDGNKTAAFWFLIAGAFMDFILQCVDSGEANEVKDGK